MDLLVTYSSHSCLRCRKYFTIALSDLAFPGRHDTRRVIEMAGRLVVEEGVPSRSASWPLWRAHRVFVPCATLQHGTEAGGKKGARPEGRRVSGRGACGVFGVCGRR